MKKGKSLVALSLVVILCLSFSPFALGTDSNEKDSGNPWFGLLPFLLTGGFSEKGLDPRIDKIELVPGTSRDLLYIYGSNFNANPNSNTVVLTGSGSKTKVPADVVSASETKLTVKLPEEARSGPLFVDVQGNWSNKVQLDPRITSTAADQASENTTHISPDSGGIPWFGMLAWLLTGGFPDNEEVATELDDGAAIIIDEGELDSEVEVTVKKLSEEEAEDLEIPDDFTATEYIYEFEIDGSSSNGVNEGTTLRFPLPEVGEEGIFMLGHDNGEDWKNVSFKKEDVYAFAEVDSLSVFGWLKDKAQVFESRIEKITDTLIDSLTIDTYISWYEEFTGLDDMIYEPLYDNGTGIEYDNSSSKGLISASFSNGELRVKNETKMYLHLYFDGPKVDPQEGGYISSDDILGRVESTPEMKECLQKAFSQGSVILLPESTADFETDLEEGESLEIKAQLSDAAALLNGLEPSFALIPIADLEAATVVRDLKGAQSEFSEGFQAFEKEWMNKTYNSLKFVEECMRAGWLLGKKVLKTIANKVLMGVPAAASIVDKSTERIEEIKNKGEDALIGGTVIFSREGDNQPPTASFTASTTSGKSPLDVSFDASESSDPDGSIDSYRWYIDEGGIKHGETITHTFDSAGDYTVQLVVTDNDGAEDSATKTISVSSPSNEPPNASFTASTTSGEAPLEVSFDASGSSDPDGSIDSYSWDFGDGSTGSGETTSHTFDSSGDYTVELTVTDNDGATDQSQVKIEVSESLEFVLWGEDNGSNLYKIDPNSGDGTLIGSIGYSNVTDIAFSADGNLYGIKYNQLLQIDQNTGEGTTVGSSGLCIGISQSDNVNALVSREDGSLIAASRSEKLMSINPDTGCATIIGELGFSSSGDLALSPDGKLFAVGVGNPDVLYQIDPNTADSTKIGSIDYEKVYGLAFSPSGVLYGASTEGTPTLIKIDPTTGTGEKIGTITNTNGSVWGLAIESES